MTRGRHNRQRAMVLMEVLVCIALIAIVLSLLGTITVRVQRLRAAHDGYLARLDAADHFLTRLRCDVRGCAGVAPTHVAGIGRDRQLHLKTRHGKILYVATDDGVHRTETAQGRVEQAQVLDAAGLRVSFRIESGASAATSVVTTVQWREPPMLGVTQPTLSVRLTPRNR